MVRRTKKTIRRVKSPTAKRIIKAANALHNLNAEFMRIADVVSDLEADSLALKKYMAHIKVIP